MEEVPASELGPSDLFIFYDIALVKVVGYETYETQEELEHVHGPEDNFFSPPRYPVTYIQYVSPTWNGELDEDGIIKDMEDTFYYAGDTVKLIEKGEII